MSRDFLKELSLRPLLFDGGMGTICAIMLAENGYPVQLWSAFPQQVEELREHRENRRFLIHSRNGSTGLERLFFRVGW